MTHHDKTSTCVQHTSDGDVVRGEGWWGPGNPLGHRLARGVEHQICEGEGAVVYSEQPEPAVILPCSSLHFQQLSYNMQAVELVFNLRQETKQYCFSQRCLLQ